MINTDRMWIVRTRQFRALVVISLALVVLVFLVRRHGNSEPEIPSIRVKKALDLSTLTLNATMERKLKEEYGLLQTKSRGATIFVDDQGRVRVPPPFILELMQFRDLEEQYHRYIESIQVPCTRQIHLGNHQDGGYDLCENQDVVPSKPCVVYSFGVRTDFSFDEELSKLYGCIIHSFDPANGMADHQHSPAVYFHSMGLWKTDEVMNTNWKMKTLNSIRTELDHQNSNIAMMKIDIEGAEWEALPEMLKSGALKGIKQLIMEFHSWVDLPPWQLDHRNKKDYRHHLNVLRGLYDEGFRIFFFKRFPGYCCLYEDEFNVSRTGCHEIHMMRVSS
ncbi:probable methyltransferase-like protein 24 [Mercenaria mercenaria]|uniref:probable methyltransferase-like protein 24 n=1 Tax=Mercenaria mercenaria TaxID=6596 RepID=UPI00234F7BAB|nr:probable methyltransferase-like protein 24 [Mercenaria mercenaria]XP_045190317.2 probable methyltransferase-like protein 24 [Mercenaria mercenaria]XP_053407585.1 probable methyltransferase-like protein 24 [Mercenaria mercenaria]